MSELRSLGVIMVSSITLKNCGCDGNAAARLSKAVPVCHIYGEAKAIEERKNEENPEEPWKGVAGELFCDVADPETGAIKRRYGSSAAFLPNAFNNFMLEEISKKIDEDVAAGRLETTVPFSWRIYAIPANNPGGYTYQADLFLSRPKDEPTPADKMLLRLGGGAMPPTLMIGSNNGGHDDV